MYNNYTKACKEVYEILKYVSKEDIEKIPIEMLEMFENEMDESYNFQYDENKEFGQQKLLEETKAILSNMFREYWATPEQREEINQFQREQRRKMELQKQEKYKYEDIFKNKNNNIEHNTEAMDLVEIKKESFIKKIISKLKSYFFRRKQ